MGIEYSRMGGEQYNEDNDDYVGLLSLLLLFSVSCVCNRVRCSNAHVVNSVGTKVKPFLRQATDRLSAKL